VASNEAEKEWQPSTDAQALANLRSLTRSYIRGELAHAAFVMQFGVQCLTHDLATPQPPMDHEDHQANCGCHWVLNSDPRCLQSAKRAAPEGVRLNEAGNPLTFCEDPDCDGHGSDD